MTNGTVLVTGAAGFIGSHVVDRLLARGWRVWGIDNFDDFYPRAVKEANLESAVLEPGFRLVEGDIRDDLLLTQIFGEEHFDAVIHLAARAGVRPSIQAPEEYYDTNVMGTVRLLDGMQRYGVRSLVFASSSSVYGERASGSEPFSESDPVDHPVSPYAATKRACELLCHTYWHLYEMRCQCLRFFTVYGPRQRPDLAIHKFARLIRQGRPVPIYGDGSAQRDFTYIDDVVNAVEASLNAVRARNGQGFEILNVGANRTVTVRELVEMLGEAMEAQPEAEFQPPQPGDVPRTWADITRIRERLGWEPGTPIEEGLRRFVAWLGAQPQTTAGRAL